jgi:endonuclease YncB( thermonuclease family)
MLAWLLSCTPRLRAAAVLALLAAALPLHAASFRGVVTHVTDGDTLWVRPSGGGRPIQLRLLDLDAPESCQPFGAQARQALKRRLLRQPVLVRTRGTDDYQRTLAQVRHDGEDVGAWLVQEGHAWAMGFKGRRGPYARLQEEARAARRGLWSAGDALEPRSFRRSHGRCG